jgi:TrmH family RNA methyltransferase
MSQPPQLITSLQNEQVKALVRLRNRRERDSRELLVIEEPLVIGRALEAGYPLQTVYFCPEQLGDHGQALLGKLSAEGQAQLVQLTPQVMAKVSYRDKPEGLLVIAPQVARRLAELSGTGKDGRPALMVVLEAVEKPGNLGAVLRIADGAGADAVLVCGQPGNSGADLFNPNVLRASRGACFTLPTVSAETGEILNFLRRNGITTVATSPSAEADYASADLALPVALVLGTEHEGLSDELLAACDRTVSIPMLGRGDSLNVAASCAVILYEAVRQRRQKKG